ncbi:hypothetical protein [Vibrio vulnificus]|uniref:hypothetical protein n=1 Tax=Vibrio vulnificus TaxID=672 RepID=UPI0005FB8260|nr:hypothetical protein [Vibrio vulnificus]
MQVRFHDDFAKKQYKRLCGAYRQRNISRISCHFTNIVFRYGGQYASDLALFIQQTESWKIEKQVGILAGKGSYSYFKAVSVSKNPYPIFKKMEQIRKQEEAPEALAVDGAESSKGKPSDYGDCDWCYVKDLEQDGCHKVGEDFVCSICHFEHLESLKVEGAESSKGGMRC